MKQNDVNRWRVLGCFQLQLGNSPCREGAALSLSVPCFLLMSNFIPSERHVIGRHSREKSLRGGVTVTVLLLAIRGVIHSLPCCIDPVLLGAGTSNAAIAIGRAVLKMD